MNSFGERLLALRTDKKISRQQLSKDLKISVRTISYLENNQRECDFDTLVAIANYFSVSLDYLLGRTNY